MPIPYNMPRSNPTQTHEPIIEIPEELIQEAHDVVKKVTKNMTSTSILDIMKYKWILYPPNSLPYKIPSGEFKHNERVLRPPRMDAVTPNCPKPGEEYDFLTGRFIHSMPRPTVILTKPPELNEQTQCQICFSTVAEFVCNNSIYVTQDNTPWYYPEILPDDSDEVKEEKRKLPSTVIGTTCAHQFCIGCYLSTNLAASRIACPRCRNTLTNETICFYPSHIFPSSSFINEDYPNGVPSHKKIRHPSALIDVIFVKYAYCQYYIYMQRIDAIREEMKKQSTRNRNEKQDLEIIIRSFNPVCEKVVARQSGNVLVYCNGELDGDFKCVKCSSKMCKLCWKYQSHDHVCKKEDRDTTELIYQHIKDIKVCPKCAYPIHKVSGCDHMFCVKCHYKFDWRTGKEITKNFHNPDFAEYLNKTGLTAAQLEANFAQGEGCLPETPLTSNIFRDEHKSLNEFLTHMRTMALTMREDEFNIGQSNTPVETYAMKFLDEQAKYTVSDFLYDVSATMKSKRIRTIFNSLSYVVSWTKVPAIFNKLWTTVRTLGIDKYMQQNNNNGTTQIPDNIYLPFIQVVKECLKEFEVLQNEINDESLRTSVMLAMRTRAGKIPILFVPMDWNAIVQTDCYYYGKVATYDDFEIADDGNYPSMFSIMEVTPKTTKYVDNYDDSELGEDSTDTEEFDSSDISDTPDSDEGTAQERVNAKLKAAEHAERRKRQEEAHARLDKKKAAKYATTKEYYQIRKTREMIIKKELEPFMRAYLTGTIGESGNLKMMTTFEAPLDANELQALENTKIEGTDAVLKDTPIGLNISKNQRPRRIKVWNWQQYKYPTFDFRRFTIDEQRDKMDL